MTELVILRGLPASGKTTYAKAYVAEDPGNRHRVNRDDLRAMLTESVFIPGVTELAVIVGRDALIKAFLKKGISVVCDDTNLPQRTARDLKRIADLAGVDFRIVDLTHVDPEECIKRDAARSGKAHVGDAVILDMWKRYVKGKACPLPYPEETSTDSSSVVPYVPKSRTPSAIIVDIDGTVAHMVGRSPYDESRVHEDKPDATIIELVRSHWEAGDEVIFCSGRTNGCREATEEWLNKHYGHDYVLFMRPSGDVRKDNIVKLGLFNENIRDNYNVRLVLDDRNQVVEMWRSLGLKVLQVADGNF